MRKKKRTTRSAAELTTLDAFLKKEGKHEEFEAVAIKETSTRQLIQSTKAQRPNQK